MRISIVLLASIAICPTASFANEPMAPVTPGSSATKARDIGGFELGMPIASAAKRAKVVYQQGELVQTVRDGIEYDFGVCPSGKIYRIESRQALGNFIPDSVFMGRLKSQLSEKYGTPSDGDAGNWGWELVEPVRYSNGSVLNFTTNWFSVLVSENMGVDVSLDMKMIDFRVCWDDKVMRNDAPRDRANDGITF